MALTGDQIQRTRFLINMSLQVLILYVFPNSPWWNLTWRELKLCITEYSLGMNIHKFSTEIIFDYSVVPALAGGVAKYLTDVPLH